MTYSVALLELHDELLVALVRVQHLFLAGVKQDLEHKKQRVSQCSQLRTHPHRASHIPSLLTLQSLSPSPAGAEVIITILNY